MRIDPLGPPGAPPERPTGPSTPRGTPAPPAEDRVELSGSDARRSVDERKLRLEALKEAILQGRYQLTDDALARAILRAAVNSHAKRV